MFVESLPTNMASYTSRNKQRVQSVADNRAQARVGEKLGARCKDVSGESLARMLERLGYALVRQKGSHARFTHLGPPQAHIVVPMHKQLKIGTLSDILKSVAEQRGVPLETLLELL